MRVDNDEANCGACGNVCLASQKCVSGACATRKGFVVFVTSTTVVPGSLNGVSGADAHCQSLADSAGLDGNFWAWLSDDTTSPSARFTQSTVPYVMTNSTRIADDWADLTDGGLQAAINVTESGGAYVPAYPYDMVGICGASHVLSNTKADGSLLSGSGPFGPGNACGNYSSTSGGAAHGEPQTVTDRWTSGCAGGSTCSKPASLYCFEQL